MNTSVMEHNLDIQNYMNVCLVYPRLFDQLVQSTSEPGEDFPIDSKVFTDMVYEQCFVTGVHILIYL